MPEPTLPLLQQTVPLLHTERLGHNARGHASVDSTSTRAAAWARDGAPEGSLVIAEEQTAGRGRHGRTWEASSGLNLTFSVILRPHLSGHRLGLVTLAAAVAVADAVADVTAPVEPTIKWPNDVQIEDRKCCGLLLESSFDGTETPSHVVLGIGLNVNQLEFAPQFADRATSLRLTIGRIVPRAPLLADLLHRIEHHYDAVQAGHDATVRHTYEKRLVGLGQPLTLHLPGAGRTVHGHFEGITDAGSLLLRTTDGLRTFHAGEVTTHLHGTGSA